MSKRMAPTSAEQLAVMRLLADVAAMKGDPPGQRQYLIDGLNALLGAQAGWFYAVDDFVPGGRPALRHQVVGTDPDPEFLNALSGLGAELPMEAEPFADHALHDASPLQLWTRDRVLGRPGARARYAASLAVYDASKVVDGAVSLYRDGPEGRRVVGVAVHRMHRERKFRPSELALLQFAVRELQDLVRRGHFPVARPTPATLSPRLRQILDRMLRGRGVKQMARELGLSVWTVREHIQRLYRHIGVRGRDELMSKFVSHNQAVNDD
jgi:DNA-binding CsgD family transcriptional regulator